MKKYLSCLTGTTFLYVSTSFLFIFSGCQNPSRPPVLPFKFEINAVVPGLYDPTKDLLTQSYPMPNGISEVTIRYTLKNSINTLPGHITATIEGSTLLSSNTFPNTVGVIPANNNFTSEFHGLAFPSGNYTLTLTYWTQGQIKHPNKSGKLDYKDSLVAQATFDYSVPVGFVDNDSDKIDDARESKLLEKFRPYYKFSIDKGQEDKNRPIDVIPFIKSSQILTTEDESAEPIIKNDVLSNDFSKVLFYTGVRPWFTNNGPSDINQNPKETNYYIDPVGDPSSVWDGATWDEVMQKGNVGLYGHVVPIFLTRDSKTKVLNFKRSDIPANGGLPGDEYYKIEYWQFYGKNGGTHEGDWTTVQLIYNPRADTLETVLFYEHGAKEIRFNMSRRKIILPYPNTNPIFPEDIIEYRGLNYGKPNPGASIHSVDIFDDIIRFSRDPITQDWSHVVVYIETGTHEPWPIQDYSYISQPGHWGDDYAHCFLTKTPPNLGEVEHPMLWQGAREIVSFNGNWGAKGGGARGPCTHDQWTWPGNSLIRSQIPHLTP